MKCYCFVFKNVSIDDILMMSNEDLVRNCSYFRDSLVKVKNGSFTKNDYGNIMFYRLMDLSKLIK